MHYISTRLLPTKTVLDHTLQVNYPVTLTKFPKHKYRHPTADLYRFLKCKQMKHLLSQFSSHNNMLAGIHSTLNVRQENSCNHYVFSLKLRKPVSM